MNQLASPDVPNFIYEVTDVDINESPLKFLLKLWEGMRKARSCIEKKSLLKRGNYKHVLVLNVGKLEKFCVIT